MRGGRRVPGGRRGCRVGHNVPEIQGEAVGLVGRPGQRHFQTARLSGVSQGVQSRRRYRRSVFGRVLTLALASPCGDPCVPSPWPRVFCGYFNRLFVVVTFSTLVVPSTAQSARGSVIPPFQRSGRGEFQAPINLTA